MVHTGECGVFGSTTMTATVMVLELSIRTTTRKKKQEKLFII